MAKKCHVNPNTCIGCGMCEGISSSVYEIVDGLAVCKFGDEPLPADLENEAEEAAAQCPAMAIEITE